jgi:hypothetical protein
LAAPLTAQGPLYVDDSAVGADDGSSWSNAFSNLQSAQAVAVPGNEIWVAAGVYVPGVAVGAPASFVLQSGVALLGGFAGSETAAWQRDPALNATLLSSGTTIVTGSAVDATAVLDGFTIAAGHAINGGGMSLSNASPTLRNCTFGGNSANSYGGAVYSVGGTPSFQRCTFVDNITWFGGGGAAIALFGSGQLSVRDCLFRSNTARAAGGWSAGGAILCWTDSSVQVVGSEFVDNEALYSSAFGADIPCYGGAVYLFEPGSTFEGNRFIRNRSHFGGAIGSFRTFSVVDCLFVGNSVQSLDQATFSGIGGAIYPQSFSTPAVVTLDGCTLAHNTASDEGGGVNLQGTATGVVTNCIAWNNSDSLGQIGTSQISGPKAKYSCVQNLFVGAPGEDPPEPSKYPGSIDANPQFVDANGANNVAGDEDDDLRLLAASPCRESGSTTPTPGGQDVDRNPRLLDGDLNGVARIDMGAFEFTHVRLSASVLNLGAGSVQLEASLTGTAGMPALLGLGQAGLGLELNPFGALFLNPLQPYVVQPMGVLPTAQSVQLVATGLVLQLQAFVLGPGGSGQLSNPVLVQI